MKQIIQLNPNRTAIIKEAFENHRQERYCSAITLLLTQVDGICCDEFEKLFFYNDRDARKNSIYKPEVEVELRKRADSLTELYLEVLKTSTGINDLSKNVCKYPVRLNRHEILHGMDYEYGTKLNSLKIISFISFINDIVRYGSDRKRSSRQ